MSRQDEITKVTDILDVNGYPFHNREEAVDAATRLVDNGIGTKDRFEADPTDYWHGELEMMEDVEIKPIEYDDKTH